MSKWEMVRLGEVCEINPSKKELSGLDQNIEVSFVPMVDLGSSQIYFEVKEKRRLAEAIKGYSYFRNHDVLLAKITPCFENGKSGVAKNLMSNIGFGSTEFIVLRPTPSVLSEWLYRCVSGEKFLNSGKKNMTGSAGQQRVSIDFIKNCPIPLPPLEVQKKIAKTLDVAAELIVLRKKQLAELDTLIQSVFYDMFGDPVLNEKGWSCCTVGETIKVLEAGWSVEGVQREKESSEKAVLKVSAVTTGVFKKTEYKVLDSNVEIKKYVFPHKGDLLFSRANTRELVGATCMVFDDYPDLLLPDKLWRIEFNNSVNYGYMKYILSDASIRSMLSNISTGTSGSMFNVSMNKLKSLGIPLPPLALQNQFANIVTKIEEQKALVQKALAESQYLFDSLMSQYFE